MRHLHRTVAMTMIELIVAMTLSVLLMVVALAITKQAFSLHANIDASVARLTDRGLLRRLIQSDFRHSESMTVSPNAVMLRGFLYRDPDRYSMTQRQAIVRYVAEPMGVAGPTGASGYLIREQWELESNSGKISGFVREPVWFGVSGLQVTSAWLGAIASIDDELARMNPTTPNDSSIHESMQKMPVSMTFDLHDAHGQIVHHQVIRHHEED